ncbi:STM4013/SEN3800 family hydrolase, partial [Salmonella enterica subsp. enterica serovar Infantis]
GVSFFNNRSGMGNVFPSMFKVSYWHPRVAWTVNESMDNQIHYIQKIMAVRAGSQPVMMYIHIDTSHDPNHWYGEGAAPGA